MFYPNKYVNIRAAILDHSFLTDHYDYDFSVFPRGSHDIYILDTLLHQSKVKMYRPQRAEFDHVLHSLCI